MTVGALTLIVLLPLLGFLLNGLLGELREMGVGKAKQKVAA